MIQYPLDNPVCRDNGIVRYLAKYFLDLFTMTNRCLLSRNTFEKGDKLVEMGENK